MKISVLFTVASALVSTNALQILSRPRLEDAADIARTLINRESLANINTVYQSGDDAGLPTSFVEYYADCGDGNPIVLAVDIGTSFRNINQGSPVSLTIRVGDHGPNENVSRTYPGSRPNSVAGSPRINLRGEFKTIDSSNQDYDDLERCFINRHRDAAWWLPGNPIHKTHFVKFEVQDAYFLGGFGDTGYIGKIPSELYHNASVLDEINEGGNVNVQRVGDDDIRDWAFEAYRMKHSLKDLSSKVYGEINNQVQFFQNVLSGDIEEGVIDLSTEENKTILDLLKSKFQKRDGQAIEQVDVRDLTREQVSEIIDELQELKTKVFEYGQSLITKFQKPEEDHRFNDRKTHKTLRPGLYTSGELYRLHHPADKEIPANLPDQLISIEQNEENENGYRISKYERIEASGDKIMAYKMIEDDNHQSPNPQGQGSKKLVNQAQH